MAKPLPDRIRDLEETLSEQPAGVVSVSVDGVTVNYNHQQALAELDRLHATLARGGR